MFELKLRHNLQPCLNAWSSTFWQSDVFYWGFRLSDISHNDECTPQQQAIYSCVYARPQCQDITRSATLRGC